MAFINTLPLLENPEIEITLLKRKKSYEKNKIGDQKIKWKEIESIRGVIQRKQNQEIDFSGSESQIAYFGMFLPTDNLLIPKNKFEDYRIKFKSDYETIVLKIKSFDPNLFIRLNRNHIEMELEEDRKWNAIITNMGK